MNVSRIVTVGLLAGGCLGPGPLRHPPAPADGAKPVWLVSHGWHVGLVLRGADVSTEVWPESADVGPFTFLDVGWGDGDFYPAARGTTALALKAAFFSGSSVLHVVGFNEPVPVAFAESTVIEIRLGVAAFDALCRFIHDAYARDATGRIGRTAPGAYGHGWFYRARGRYHVFDNSNTWAARGLQAAGLPFGYVLTAGSLLQQARRFGTVIRDGGASSGTISPGSARTAAFPRKRGVRPGCRAARGSCSRAGSRGGGPPPA